MDVMSPAQSRSRPAARLAKFPACVPGRALERPIHHGPAGPRADRRHSCPPAPPGRIARIGLLVHEQMPPLNTLTGDLTVV